jgi:cell division protein FtsL
VKAKAGRLRGRHWVALWLAVLLLTALAVVWRQGTALASARELQSLEKVRGALDVQRSSLVGDIHRARSRAVLVPLAERRLGLRLPQDSEITILQDPSLR